MEVTENTKKLLKFVGTKFENGELDNDSLLFNKYNYICLMLINKLKK